MLSSTHVLANKNWIILNQFNRRKQVVHMSQAIIHSFQVNQFPVDDGMDDSYENKQIWKCHFFPSLQHRAECVLEFIEGTPKSVSFLFLFKYSSKWLVLFERKEPEKCTK